MRKANAAMSPGERRNLKRMVMVRTPRKLSVLPNGQRLRGNDIVLPRVRVSPAMTTKGIQGTLRKPRLF